MLLIKRKRYITRSKDTIKKKNKHIPQFFENLGKKVFHTVELLQRFKIGRYMRLMDELQNRPFSATHGSAFLKVRRTTSASTKLPLDESQNSSHNQSLKTSSS